MTPSTLVSCSIRGWCSLLVFRRARIYIAARNQSGRVCLPTVRLCRSEQSLARTVSPRSALLSHEYSTDATTVPRTTCRPQTAYACCSKTFARLDSQRSDSVCKVSILSTSWHVNSHFMTVSGSDRPTQMPNLSRMEINEIKPFFAAAHSRLLDLDPRSEELNAMEELWRDKPDSALQRAEQFARQASIG